MDSEINLASRRFEVLKNKIWTFLAQGLVNVFNEALPFFVFFTETSPEGYNVNHFSVSHFLSNCFE